MSMTMSRNLILILIHATLTLSIDTNPYLESRYNKDWIDPFDMSGGKKYSSQDKTYKSLDSSSVGYPKSGRTKRVADENLYFDYSSNNEDWIDPFDMSGGKQLPSSKDKTYKSLDSQIIDPPKADWIDPFDMRPDPPGWKHQYDYNSYSSKSKSQSYMGLSDISLWLKKSLYKLITSPEWIVTTSILLMSASMMWGVFITGSFRMATLTMFLMIFFAGFGLTWMRMYEEKEIERYYDSIKHNGDVPYHCKGDLYWYENIWYSWFGDDCLTYYKRRDIRPIVKVSPTEVLSETISRMVIEPAKNIGQAYGTFIQAVIKSVPWYVKILAVPFAFIVPPVFVIVLIALFSNYSLGFSITGLYLKPSSGRCSKLESKYINDISSKQHACCVKDTITVLNCQKDLSLNNCPKIKNHLLKKCCNLGYDKDETSKANKGLDDNCKVEQSYGQESNNKDSEEVCKICNNNITTIGEENAQGIASNTCEEINNYLVTQEVALDNCQERKNLSKKCCSSGFVKDKTGGENTGLNAECKAEQSCDKDSINGVSENENAQGITSSTYKEANNSLVTQLTDAVCCPLSEARNTTSNDSADDTFCNAFECINTST